MDYLNSGNTNQPAYTTPGFNPNRTSEWQSFATPSNSAPSWWSSRNGSQQASLISGGLGALANIYNIRQTNKLARDQRKDARAMRREAAGLQDQYDAKMAEINNSYKEGTPEYEAMMEAMARQDAAAGRNSQYGQRAVDLAVQSQLARSKIMSEQSPYLNTLMNQRYSLNQDASNLRFQAGQNRLQSRAGFASSLAGLADAYYRPAPRYSY